MEVFELAGQFEVVGCDDAGVIEEALGDSLHCEVEALEGLDLPSSDEFEGWDMFADQVLE